MKGRMKEQTSLFKVGDIVWSDYFGAGVVYKIIASAAHYPICVEWKDDRWLGLHYFFRQKDNTVSVILTQKKTLN